MSAIKSAHICKLEKEFEFAGFTWPRYVAVLPNGSMVDRLKRAKERFTGAYYHAPKPGNDGRGFYLSETSGMGFNLRWQWADDIDSSIEHTGWWCDDYQDQKIRGIVFSLAHGRGWLAGWSMGEGMCGEIEYYIYADAESAALAADSIAESMAEKEREYREESEEGENE